jgi:transposase
VLRMVSTY